MTVPLVPTEESILARLLPELLRLSPAARLKVAGQLVESVQGESLTTKHRKTLADFIGSWANDPDADAMEEAIRNSRYSESNPRLENWD